MNLLRDIVTIYISHIILHVGLSYNMPWPISSITITIFICSCFLLFEEIKMALGRNNENKIRKISVKYSWIFFLHYIPILWNNDFKFVAIHVLVYICGFVLYTSKIIKNVYINNAIMHCGLILNNWFAFRFV